MATVTLNLTTPQGHPMALTVSPDDNGEAVQDLLDRSEKLAGFLASRGWGFAEAPATGPSVAELTAGPTFAGYPCSPTTDAAGMPTWILVGDRQAHRREKQGDVWYSYKDGEAYVQALRIPKGEQAPPVLGLS